MANDINTLPSHKLYILKKSDGIPIRYFPDGNTPGLILYADFPKGVAVQFSNEKWAKQFPAAPNRKDLFCDHPAELHIRDCDQDKALEILDKYWDLRNAASAIGCTYLVNDFHSRMASIAERQIHSEDIRAIFEKVHRGQLDQNDEILDFLARHVACHIFDQTLRAKHAYNAYRDENNLFNYKVESYLIPLIDERRAHNEAERRIEQNEALAKQISDAAASKGADQIKINDDGTAKLSCDVAVRGKESRPTFVRPPPDLLMDSSKLHRKGYEGGGKTPQRFRHKEGQVEKADGIVDGVDKLAKDIADLKIDATAINSNGVGGKMIPGISDHVKVPMSKNARKRAKKQAQKAAEAKSEGLNTGEKKDVEDKVGERLDATAQ